MTDIIYKKESYQIIGLCMEVHNQLGPGFLEVVYKDALEVEFKKSGIPFCREKPFRINYKGQDLPHYFASDFLVFDEIILEVKCNSKAMDIHLAQCINYLKASSCQLGLLVNFGAKKLMYERVLLNA